MDLNHQKMREALLIIQPKANLDKEARLAFELCRWMAIQKLDDLLAETILEYEEYLAQQHMESSDDPMY